MKQQQDIMGMPITVEVVGRDDAAVLIKKVFDYFKDVDEKFSPFKSQSEVTKINNGEIFPGEYSDEMKQVLDLTEKTWRETNGYFEVVFNGQFNPSGLVKGWAIQNAAQILRRAGVKNFYINAGGDIEVGGKNEADQTWSVGIRNPFAQDKVAKIVYTAGGGIATSGTYLRGEHIYNPKNGAAVNEIVSLTVIGPNIFDADRYATAAFAMGKKAIEFIEKLIGFEGYMIDTQGIGTMTSGFDKYSIKQ
ncbi:MAG: FAD:protein FMN transferase [Patescibacteria group bacterium]|nr:FAD:protein FMN transferase [Patescibacteria group bacterium]